MHRSLSLLLLLLLSLCCWLTLRRTVGPKLRSRRQALQVHSGGSHFVMLGPLPLLPCCRCDAPSFCRSF